MLASGYNMLISILFLVSVCWFTFSVVWFVHLMLTFYLEIF